VKRNSLWGMTMGLPLTILPHIPAEIQRRSVFPRPSGPAPTFALYTLGCKVNQYDSHQIARMLVAQGFRRVEFREPADLYVIDTCTVTAEADRKSRKAAGRARRNNPDAIVAVTGCAATRDERQFLALVPDALVLSNTRKFELPRPGTIGATRKVGRKLRCLACPNWLRARAWRHA